MSWRLRVVLRAGVSELAYTAAWVVGTATVTWEWPSQDDVMLGLFVALAPTAVDVARLIVRPARPVWWIAAVKWIHARRRRFSKRWDEGT